MKKIKRVLALIGVVLLVSMYIITLISALIDSPYSNSLFQASIFATFVVPIFIYGVMLIYRLLKDKNNDSDNK